MVLGQQNHRDQQAQTLPIVRCSYLLTSLPLLISKIRVFSLEFSMWLMDRCWSLVLEGVENYMRTCKYMQLLVWQ